MVIRLPNIHIHAIINSRIPAAKIRLLNETPKTGSRVCRTSAALPEAITFAIAVIKSNPPHVKIYKPDIFLNGIDINKYY